MRCIHGLFSFVILLVIALVGCAAPSPRAPQAQEEITYKYNLGRTPSAEEIRAWDISVDPSGKGLPPGSGTAKKGAAIFARKCGLCHGPTGEGPSNPAGGFDGRLGFIALVGDRSAVIFEESRLQGIGGYATAPALWENIKRSMPPVSPMASGSLSADEAYAVTAYLLYRNGIIQESDVMNAQSLPKVEMPKRDEREPRMRQYMAAPVP